MLRITTENGSVYQLSQEDMTFVRVDKTDRSGAVRGEIGELLEWPKLDIGRPLAMLCKSLTPGLTARVVLTSHIIGIEYPPED